MLADSCISPHVMRTGYVQNNMVYSITPLLHTAPQRSKCVRITQHWIGSDLQQFNGMWERRSVLTAQRKFHDAQCAHACSAQCTAHAQSQVVLWRTVGQLAVVAPSLATATLQQLRRCAAETRVGVVDYGCGLWIYGSSNPSRSTEQSVFACQDMCRYDIDRR